MTSSSPAIELREGSLRLVLRPDLGGAIAGFWLGANPVLRSCEADALDSARPSGCFALVPYSNRISNGRFAWGGQAHAVAPNLDGSPHPIHGIGWTRPWRVERHDARETTLTLSHAGDRDWPFAFDAEQRFALDASGLAIELSLVNRANATAPAGLGWHPYFPKRLRSRIHAETAGRWDNDADNLPLRRVAQHAVDGDVAPLQYDNGFDGWNGTARIRDETLSVTLTSSLGHLVVFTPADRDYFCVEPVSHRNNALADADAIGLGIRALEPGESIGAWMRLRVDDVHA